MDLLIGKSTIRSIVIKQKDYQLAKVNVIKHIKKN